MLFKRREQPTISETIRVALWPRRNWKRSFRYILLRLSRLRTTPHAIAIGTAAGVLISFTPFLGFHFLLAGLLAYALRGSVVASALGTFFGNPLTFPFIWAGSYELGNHILGLEAQGGAEGLVTQLATLTAALAQASFEAVMLALQALWPLVLKPMMVGSLPMGMVAGMLSYVLVKKLADSGCHGSPEGICRRG